jgi:hypothetical protein
MTLLRLQVLGSLLILFSASTGILAQHTCWRHKLGGVSSLEFPEVYTTVLLGQLCCSMCLIYKAILQPELGWAGRVLGARLVTALGTAPQSI